MKKQVLCIKLYYSDLGRVRMVTRTQMPTPNIESASICKPMAGRVLWGFVFFMSSYNSRNG